VSSSTHKWLKALAAAIITGFSNSFLSAVGVASAEMVGMKIENLSPKQLLIMTLMGGLVGMFAYLKQSPVPLNGDTVFVTKNKDNEKSNPSNG
jgi:hypothetical protein